jgi:LmbE family N-acetylglucosaminyl deacetylase
MKKNIMIVAAHPDDEILGCGGTMSKKIKEGYKVDVVIMGQGLTSRKNYQSKNKIKKNIIKLKKSSLSANKFIGATSVKNLLLPDNSMDSVNFLKVVHLLELEIFNKKPSIVFTHHLGDLNIDHKITHQAVITACRPVPNFCVKKIYSFEVVSSTEWQSSSNNNPFVPTYFEDISDHIKDKINALKYYDSEMRKAPHARSYENVKNLAKFRGSSIGVMAAEAFITIRDIN